MSIDLHCHTKISDGSLGIDELLAVARRRGLSALAVTDHDAVVGATRAVVTGRRLGIDVIHGVEFSAKDPVRGGKVHVLGYLSSSPDRLEGLCRDISTARRAAAAEMIRKVLRYYPIVPDMITRCASGSNAVYKQHIMHALMDAGYTDRIYGPVYDKLFSPEGGCALVRMDYPDVRTVIGRIREAGGLAVLAHPCHYHNEALMEELIAEDLLDGIEVWHPEQTEQQCRDLAQLAAQHGLLATGGSDFHGMYSHILRPIGYADLPENTPQLMRNFRARRQARTG